MIRFIDLGKQIAVDETDPDYPRQFSFYDTCADRFVSINGYMVFDSLADLLSEMEQDFTDPLFYNRLLGLLPDWVKVMRVYNPRSSFVIEGLPLPVQPPSIAQNSLPVRPKG